MAAGKRRILVAALHNLGDAVMGSALLPALRRLEPEAELGLWVKDYARELFDLPGVRVHAADPFWDAAPGRGKGSLRRFVGELARIGACGYDAVLVLDCDWRRALACRLAGIPQRAGLRQRKSGPFLTVAVEPAPAGHVVEDHARLASAWCGRSVPLDWLVPEIGLSTRQKERGVRWRAELGWQDGTLAALHLISGDPEKNWPLEKWSQLAARLCERRPDLRLAVLSSPSEEPVLRRAMRDLPEGRVRVVTGSISAIKEILSQAALFVGGDSGPGHMAAALGVPVVSLFGPTEPGRYRPLGRADVHVIRRQPVAGVSVAEVLEAVSALLPAGPRP